MRPWAPALVAGLCEEHAGLCLANQTADRIETRLAPLARREGFASVDDLLTAVRDRDDARLVWRVVEAMAPGQADFFHEPETIDHLCDAVLPDQARARADGRLRVWAAGCGTGQDVYSLAMALEERTLQLNVEIFASDLSEARLEKAQAGIYTPFEIQRGLSAQRLVRCFEKRDEIFVLSPRLRQRILWARVNMIEDLARLGKFDVILCRGVLCGFTDEVRTRLGKAMGAALRPNGRLVLDGAEKAPPGWQAIIGPAGAFAPDSHVMLAA